jgi:FkbM family methyltransferase
MERIFWKIRRLILKTLVPEFIWPNNVLIDGVFIKIRNTPYSFGSKLILTNGQYEEAERILLKEELKENDIVFEMGGSIGILTAIMGKAVGEKGLVISIEASEIISTYSKSWLEKNGNIKIECGFGFPVYELNKGIKINHFDESAGSLGGILSFDIVEDQNELEFENWQCLDIKYLMKKYKVEPNVLVIDIEGSEIIILNEEACLPLSIRIIIIELHPHIYGKEKVDAIIQKIIDQKFFLEDQVSDVYLFKRV